MEKKGEESVRENQVKLAIGGMLHDIGKVVYRGGDGRNHSQSGYEFLKNEVGLADPDILNCVQYHHGARLKQAKIPDDDMAYLVYYADNIAAASDRREGMEGEDGFDQTVPLASVFNILNGNNGHSHFAKQVVNVKNGINYPTDKPISMDQGFYQEIIRNITDNLKGAFFTSEYVNSLLAVLEANLSYIPSSTSKRELADISLFDHVKMTAAFALCMEQYFTDQGIRNFKEKLLLHGKDTYAEKMFLLYSMDMSGIQNFIYTISSKGALKTLRARSFYLEILMEHIIDELLEQLSLSRTNLIYCGGGHSYLLLPNTENVKEIIEGYEHSINQWFLENFGIALYLAAGYEACSANDLKNEPRGSYSNLYIKVSKMISEKKAHRYTAEDICKLNKKNHDEERECRVCRKLEKLNKDGLCETCAAIEQMSGNILYQQFFVVMTQKESGALPLPGGRYLAADTKEGLKNRMGESTYVRAYTKNDMYTGKHVATKLWVGDYTTGDTFEEFAQKADGIKRIGVLRADVDSLGKTFVYGFQRPDGDDRYATLSRTATLSRQLSMFFKYYINDVLKNGETQWLSGDTERNTTIVYSGGDDIFLVGSWNDVIAAFIDLRNALQRFTQGTLTISGGVGLYQPGYPINMIAGEVADLEDFSKSLPGKNGITLFNEESGYSWDVFLNQVLGEKFSEISTFFKATEERGMSFLYHLLELLRNGDDKIQTARYVYLLSRMEPDPDSGKEQWNRYRHFSKKMYEWMKEKEDRKQVITALYLYVYLNREEERNGEIE